jgi:hypothetical protein
MSYSTGGDRTLTGEKIAYIRQLKQRHNALAWWARVSKNHPLGVVPVSTAARILHVTPNRVRQLIKNGRIRVLDDMPGGSSHDRFIPIEDLLDAPFAMTRGRPGVYGPKNRFTEEKLQQMKSDPYSPLR